MQWGSGWSWSKQLLAARSMPAVRALEGLANIVSVLIDALLMSA